MSDNIDKLTGAELSAAVAREVMGWKYVPPVIHEPAFEHRNIGERWETPVGNLRAVDWRPYDDRNDTHRLLARCEAIGIGYEVWTRLPEECHRDGWLLLTIDPQIICRAALLAVRASQVVPA